jgi:polyisoprenoid-binding protein YceI
MVKCTNNKKGISMKIYKLIIIALITTFALCWEWPWSSPSETKHSLGVELPKGIHSILYDESKLIWKGEKAIGDSHTGNIKIKSGEVIIDGFGRVNGRLVIDMNTINCTDLEGEWKNKLEGHLKSDDFFSVDTYNISTIDFQSIKRNGNLVDFDGNLTIKDISHPVSFTARISESNEKILAKSKVVFDRSKYNVKYGSGTFFEDLGDYLILDEVSLDVTIVIN